MHFNRPPPVTIRVNPDIDAKTHAKITTGTSETKFGVPWSRARAAYALAARLPYLFACNRFAHYLKVMARDKIGSFMEAKDCAQWLNDWIRQYIFPGAYLPSLSQIAPILENLGLFLTVKNLADKTYITDRTRGILTGQPRLVQAGARYTF